ncbi:DMT family transporter [Jannaschia sp. Os4]|uniref:DMT family transporter n=1 Tax=Jannaschia sp. Os4 TaxID=2807617 RepID=UPI00193A3AB3|nr:DMT family transporter [Jannaschia sp. Os4]MBM2576716.1 DMT family transporter [Jannaschia sp. Os4]
MTATTDAPVARPTRANFSAVAALGLIWGGTFTVTELALVGYGPHTVAAARVALGAAALTALAVVLRRPLPAWSPLTALFLALIGLTTAALPFTALAWGQTRTTAAFAGLAMAMLPLLLLPLAHVFVPGDRLTWRKAAGFGLGAVGALILIGPGALDPSGGNGEGWGQLACLAAVVCYAVGSILTRRCPPVDGVWLSALSLWAGAAALVPAMLWREGLPTAAAPSVLAAILFLGLVPTALAALLRISVIRSAGPSFMTLVNYQVPVWAMGTGALFLGEALPGRFFLALTLILGGLALGQGRQLAALLGGERAR